MNNEGRDLLASLQANRGSVSFTTEKVRRVLEYLGNPHLNVQAFHVGGTNGKGSISTALASILGAAGLRVCLSTSPHLHSYTERIVVDGTPVTEDQLLPYADVLARACRESRTTLSLHESMVVLAFLLCVGESIPWIVLEVGLGGERDSTNVIERPAATVISSVDYDHVHLLGPTLIDIAREKGGIIKSHVPLVSGVKDRAAAGVLREMAVQKSAPMYELGLDILLNSSPEGFSVRLPTEEEVTFSPSLAGSHQARNMALAIAAARAAGLSAEACRAGVASVFWPARLETIKVQGESTCLLDAAHNPAGIASLVTYLEEKKSEGVTLVFGVLATKEWQEMVRQLLPRVKRWLLLTPRHSRAVPTHELAEYLSCLGISEINDMGERYDGCASYIRERSREEEVVVTGSMYMVARLRELLTKADKPYWTRRGA